MAAVKEKGGGEEMVWLFPHADTCGREGLAWHIACQRPWHSHEAQFRLGACLSMHPSRERHPHISKFRDAFIIQLHKTHLKQQL